MTDPTNAFNSYAHWRDHMRATIYEFPWDAWASGYREYLPIPPSDERRG